MRPRVYRCHEGTYGHFFRNKFWKYILESCGSLLDRLIGSMSYLQDLGVEACWLLYRLTLYFMHVF